MNTNGLNGGGHDVGSSRQDFHTESGIDSTDLEEASTKRATGEARSSLAGKEASSANDNLACRSVDH